MAVYFIVLLSLAIGHYSDPAAKQLQKRLCINFIVIFILCFGYMTGSDWRSYESYYVENHPFDFTWEPGFIIFQSIFQLLGIDFWIYAIFCKIIIYLTIEKLIRQYSYGNYYLNLSLFCVFIGIGGLVDFSMRNMLSLAIGTHCFKYYSRRKAGQYFFYALLALSFHVSAALLFILYCIRIDRVSSKKLVVSFVLFNIVISFQYQLLFNVIGVFLYGTILRKYAIMYFLDEQTGIDKGISLGFLFHAIAFFLIVRNRKRILACNYGDVMFVCGILYPFLYRIALIFSIGYRFLLFLGILYCCCLGYTIITHRYRKFLCRYSYIYLFLVTYSLVTMNYKYVPYTHYLLEVWDNRSYTERSNYNYKYSPYHK